MDDSIRALRKRHKLRLSDLSNAVGISIADMSRYERGLVLPDTKVLEKLSNVFSISASSLYHTQKSLFEKSTIGEGYTTLSHSLKDISIPPKHPLDNSKTHVIDLFCGTGGFSYGFEQTNLFQVTFGLDLLSDRIETFSINHPSAYSFCRDIYSFRTDDLLKYSPKPSIIIGGPPCQGFSSIRPFRTLTEGDVRNNLINQFFFWVNALKPDWYVFENVVGMLTHKSGKTFKTTISTSESLGYKTTWKVINASHYGLPQRRERLFVIGNKLGIDYEWPKPTHYFECRSMAGYRYGDHLNQPMLFDDLSPAVTVMDAIHDLPKLESGESSSVYRSDVILTDYEHKLRGNEEKLTLHEATKHSPKMLEIIKHAGNNRNQLPEGLTKSGFSSSYSRMEANIPCVTLTVNFVHPASNKCIHPYQNRALTPREGARLQSFPDCYSFIGTRSQIVKQIGNAVPPLLGSIIATSLARYL